MGFLLYGEPGCGKTSTIKAIANHTQRHIVAVPLNKIKTGKELLNVFYNVKMNYQVGCRENKDGKKGTRHDK
jgi:replication-associated recombination protein RarA